MSEEIWRDVIGYEGLYQVSNHGQVKRILLTNNKNPGGIMTARRKQSTGLVVCLCKNGKGRERAVCTLVYEAFGPDITVNIFPGDALLDGEEFRPVVGFETRYAVSNFGRLKSLVAGPATYPGKVLLLATKSSGYLEAGLWDQEKITYARVHRLVCEAFIGPRPEGHIINHKDGVKKNNRADNLEYVTHQENCRHSIEVLGNRVDGEFNSAAKLTREQVEDIRRLYRLSGRSQQSIADQFQIHQTQVSRIVRGASW